MSIIGFSNYRTSNSVAWIHFFHLPKEGQNNNDTVSHRYSHAYYRGPKDVHLLRSRIPNKSKWFLKDKENQL